MSATASIPRALTIGPTRPRTPAVLQKRKLTLAEAADQFEKAKREIDRQKALIEEASPVLLAHFERSGRSTYKDRIAREPTGGSLVLDQPRVREFQKRTARGWTLKLLK
jgi:hypothetical protein